MSHTELALGRARGLEGVFQILSENAASYEAWKTLLIANRVSGIQVHDVQLVAVMLRKLWLST